jgi:DNA-binding NarL/FixJ family response regulator
MNKYRILLADDHRIFLEGLKNLLQDDFEVVSMVEDGLDLVKEAIRLDPDVIIADISMPSLNGIDAFKRILKSGKSPRVIFLTMHDDAMYAKEVLDAGAFGYVLKHAASAELVAAIREAVKGNIHISASISHDLIKLYKDDKPGGEGEIVLSLRQREVLQLFVEGKTAKEVASLLNITSRTVEFHKYTIMQRLNIRTTAELIRYAVTNKIVSI